MSAAIVDRPTVGTDQGTVDHDVALTLNDDIVRSDHDSPCRNDKAVDLDQALNFLWTARNARPLNRRRYTYIGVQEQNQRTHDQRDDRTKAGGVHCGSPSLCECA
ncbi:MAG: hypothetical protein AB7G11_06515 [Phycisphaerales bacterium]